MASLNKKRFRVSTLGLALCLSGAEASPSPGNDFILSVTASSEFATENHLLQYNPSNVAEEYGSEVFPYFEACLAAAYDPSRGRYFAYLEPYIVNIYNSTTLELLSPGPIYINDITIQFAASMVYAQSTDLLWFMWTAMEAGEYSVPNQFCSKEARVLGASACYTFPEALYPSSNTYVYVPDAAAFDPSTAMYYQQVQVLFGLGSGDNYLVAFNTSSLEYSPPAPMREICQGMEVAYVGGLPQLLCIEFTGQRLVEVDPCSGASTRVVFDLPGLSNRVPNTSAKRNSPGGESSSYFVQIQSATSYTWLELDVASGAVMSNSSYPVKGNVQLAMPVYVAVAA